MDHMTFLLQEHSQVPESMKFSTVILMTGISVVHEKWFFQRAVNCIVRLWTSAEALSVLFVWPKMVVVKYGMAKYVSAHYFLGVHKELSPSYQPTWPAKHIYDLNTTLTILQLQEEHTGRKLATSYLEVQGPLFLQAQP